MHRIVVALFASLVVGCTQVDTGNVGIESVWGQVKEQALPPGVYFTLFKNVTEVTAKEVPVELDNMRPKTSDNVTLQDVDITIYFQIDGQRAAQLFTRYAGDLVVLRDSRDYALATGLITRMARESTYRAIAKLQSSDAHTKRTDIALDVRQSLQQEVDSDAGKGWLRVTNVIVRNLVTDSGLEASIKEAAQVEFHIRQKKQQIELAKSEAERIRVEAEGVARANTIIANSLTPTLIEMRRVEMMATFATKGTNTVLLPQGVQPLITVK